jgi:hypothetical protein
MGNGADSKSSEHQLQRVARQRVGDLVGQHAHQAHAQRGRADRRPRVFTSRRETTGTDSADLPLPNTQARLDSITSN